MDYTRSDVLSIQLRNMTNLRRLTRNEFFSRLQLMQTIEPMTALGYREVERAAWEEGGEAPHGLPWHVSFHGSQFPEGEMACPRQALYRLMDIPSAEPFDRNSRTVMEAGKGIERELVRVWNKMGILVSSEDPDDQTGFMDKEHWLTCSVDSLIYLDQLKMVVPVEVKTKYDNVVREMRVGMRGPDEAHVRQCKVQIAMLRALQDDGGFTDAGEVFDENLHEVDRGFIYYLSRDKPMTTAEFRVDYDPTFYLAGLEKLEQWKQWFLDDQLPSIDPSKKHPMGWRWTYDPCRYCDFKKVCQTDHNKNEDPVTQLTKSHAVTFAKEIRPGYDPQKVRLKVKKQWDS